MTASRDGDCSVGASGADRVVSVSVSECVRKIFFCVIVTQWRPVLPRYAYD